MRSTPSLRLTSSALARPRGRRTGWCQRTTRLMPSRGGAGRRVRSGRWAKPMRRRRRSRPSVSRGAVTPRCSASRAAIRRARAGHRHRPRPCGVGWWWARSCWPWPPLRPRERFWPDPRVRTARSRRRPRPLLRPGRRRRTGSSRRSCRSWPQPAPRGWCGWARPGPPPIRPAPRHGDRGRLHLRGPAGRSAGGTEPAGEPAQGDAHERHGRIPSAGGRRQGPQPEGL